MTAIRLCISGGSGRNRTTDTRIFKPRFSQRIPAPAVAAPRHKPRSPKECGLRVRLLIAAPHPARCLVAWLPCCRAQKLCVRRAGAAHTCPFLMHALSNTRFHVHRACMACMQQVAARHTATARLQAARQRPVSPSNHSGMRLQGRAWRQRLASIRKQALSLALR